MLCEGDPEVTCGGYEAFDLYQLEWAEASTSDEYVGCFADMKSDRVMHDLMVMDDMTESTCRAHCSSRDALYYATQVKALSVFTRSKTCAAPMAL